MTENSLAELPIRLQFASHNLAYTLSRERATNASLFNVDNWLFRLRITVFYISKEQPGYAVLKLIDWKKRHHIYLS